MAQAAEPEFIQNPRVLTGFTHSMRPEPSFSDRRQFLRGENCIPEHRPLKPNKQRAYLNVSAVMIIGR